MSKTFAQLTYLVAREVGNLVEGAATGGSATTLIDTLFPYRDKSDYPPADDFYNRGTIWGLSGAISGSTLLVTDWARSGPVATFPTITPDTVSAGDRYAILDNVFPLWKLKQAVNKALARLSLPAEYTNASYVTVADQEEYDFPAGVTTVCQVWIGQSTVEPYTYIQNTGCTIHVDKFSFLADRVPGVAGYPIKLVYMAQPSELVDDDDEISDLIHPDLIKWYAVADCFEWRLSLVEDDFMRERLNKALQLSKRADSDHGIEWPPTIIEGGYYESSPF